LINLIADRESASRTEPMSHGRLGGGREKGKLGARRRSKKREEEAFSSSRRERGNRTTMAERIRTGENKKNSKGDNARHSGGGERKNSRVARTRVRTSGRKLVKSRRWRNKATWAPRDSSRLVNGHE